jgi:hypothetical protein
MNQGLEVAEEAGRIGHDLNNCLGVVSGRAELIRMHLDRGNAEGARKGIEAMKELSDALRELRSRFSGPPGS